MRNILFLISAGFLNLFLFRFNRARRKVCLNFVSSAGQLMAGDSSCRKGSKTERKFVVTVRKRESNSNSRD